MEMSFKSKGNKLSISDQKISIAVVGCGHWGKNLVRNFDALGVLNAVVDIDPSIANRISSQYSVRALTFPEALQDSNIDALVISAPASHHYALTKEALLARKHVFVEKPLSLEIIEAQQLCEIAEQNSLTLMVGHLMQFHPAFLKLQEICMAGNIGELRYAYSNRMNLGKVRTEENILWSFAPHDISMILGIFGTDVDTVSATGHCYISSEIADVTSTNISFKNGQAAHIQVSWLHPFKEQRLVIIGEKGMAVFDDSLPWNEKLGLYFHEIAWQNGQPSAKKVDPVWVPLEELEPLKIECDHFLNSIRNGTRPRTDGAEGLRVLRVLDAAQRSMEVGHSITMDQTDEVNPMTTFIHPTAEVDQPSVIGEGTRIWHFSHIMKNSEIGENCNIGQNVMIGPNVKVGARCKIQNNVSVYPGVILEDGVFCGPSMVFTNVINPRAEIERKDEFKPTVVKSGATIGANATVICGNKIGKYAMIGAGAVVTKDVDDFALMVGNPAQKIGHVCKCGTRLEENDRDITCHSCGSKYTAISSGMIEEDPNK